MLVVIGPGESKDKLGLYLHGSSKCPCCTHSCLVEIQDKIELPCPPRQAHGLLEPTLRRPSYAATS